MSEKKAAEPTASERMAKEREKAEKRKQVEKAVADARALQELEQKEKDKLENQSKLFGTHVGITCDGCGTAPVVGFRWHCLKCRNHDLCDACHEQFKGGKLPHNNRLNNVSQQLENHVFEIEASYGNGFKPMDRSVYQPKVKRVKPNEPCTCGSGKKYKKCCGDPTKKPEEEAVEEKAS
ncbi:Protein ref(2)P [Diplonema papillatum]|nr:Protein ref(2)P [Diplonema papillatum]